jgi:hypothetical protein
VIFFTAAVAWGVLLIRALFAPEAHLVAWWRALAFVVMLIAGAMAFPRRLP